MRTDNNLIYTPRHHIPLGEAIVTADGIIALRVKKAKGNIIETVTLDHLISLLASGINRCQDAGNPSEDVAS